MATNATRVKFLAHPGHDLDAIAVSQTLKTKFSPARDGYGRPTRSLVVWPIEWPSYWWMNARLGIVTRMPDRVMDGFDTSHVPCRGSGRPMSVGSVHPSFRDCSLPDVSKINSAEPWIEATSLHR